MKTLHELPKLITTILYVLVACVIACIQLPILLISVLIDCITLFRFGIVIKVDDYLYDNFSYAVNYNEAL